MIWHYLREAIGIVVIVHGLLSFRRFRAGDFRRIWNWPMRIAVVFWLSAGVFGCLGAWIGKQPGGVIVGNGLGKAAIYALLAGIISLLIFLAGFLVTMFRDFQPRNRPGQNAEDISQRNRYER